MKPNPSSHHRSLAAAVAAAASFAVVFPATAATLQGLWDFADGGNLGAATVGSDLTVAGTAPFWTAAMADDNALALDGVIATTAGAGNHLSSVHGIPPNGGGGFVNQYSFLVDLFSPPGSADSWRAIYQTNVANSNDGDYFISPADQLGVADLTYSGGTIDNGAWTRLVVTFDNGNEIKTYLDGAEFHTHNASSVDGRFSLDPTVHFFADNDGENATLYVGALALWDGALSGGEVAALGRAGNAIPEPSAAVLGLAALAGLALRRRRRG